jgi:hypothetical protein
MEALGLISVSLQVQKVTLAILVLKGLLVHKALQEALERPDLKGQPALRD